MINIISRGSTLELPKLENDGSRLIILLPVTRDLKINTTYLSNLEKLFRNADLHSVIVIDKTNDQFLQNYILEEFSDFHFNFFIIKRPVDESIFDSQKLVKIPSGTYIIQLHDDDTWIGFPKIPKLEFTNTYFCFNFVVVFKGKSVKLKQKQHIPAQTIFSCIPSAIWNRFAHFIEEQGGHVAGSLDSNIDLIVNLICEQRFLGGFEYRYSIQNWKNKKVSKKHLTRMVEDDGWGIYSSPEIAVINRNLDALAALMKFKDLITIDQFNESTNKILDSFRLRLISRQKNLIKFCFHTFVFKGLTATKAILQFFNFPDLTFLSKKVVLRSNSIKRTKILLKFSRIYNFENINQILSFDFEESLIPKLVLRVDFWKKTFSNILYN